MLLVYYNLSKMQKRNEVLGLIFSDKLYLKSVAEMILNGKKTQTRRLVKEREHAASENGFIDTVYSDNRIGYGKVKWQVGRDYAVQLGRGKPELRYCPKCKNYTEMLPPAEDLKSYEIKGILASQAFARNACWTFRKKMQRRKDSKTSKTLLKHFTE